MPRFDPAEFGRQLARLTPHELRQTEGMVAEARKRAECGSACNKGSDSLSVQRMGHIGTLVARCCDWELLMPEARKSARLLPSGLVVDEVTVGPDEVVIAAHALGRSAECPGCGRLSRRVHSRYERCLSDVPAHGCRVRV